MYWDENNQPTDLYVNGTNFTLPNLVPCMSYRVQVNAVVTNPDWVGPTNEVIAMGLPTGRYKVSLLVLNASLRFYCSSYSTEASIFDYD